LANENNNNAGNPQKKAPSMYKKYTSWATKPDADGGNTNLWLNNAGFFALGVAADALLFKFGQAKS
jgi:hypothetical protein